MREAVAWDSFLIGVYSQILTAMNWTDSRKSHQCLDIFPNVSRFEQSVFPETPPRAEKNKPVQLSSEKITHKSQSSKQCPYHFCGNTHACLDCKKSICLRCAITYCQSHDIHKQENILPILKKELQVLHIEPKIEEISIRLSQSRGRQQYFDSRISRVLENVQEHFALVARQLMRKKEQIVSHLRQEFMQCLSEYRHYDAELNYRLEYLRNIQTEDYGVEEINRTISELRKIGGEIKIEKRLGRVLMGKEKMSVDKVWCEINLEKVLFEIEAIPFGNIEDKIKRPRKRFTTENALESRSALRMAKSSSNSRVPSGKKTEELR